jgi:hypothetical protein
MLGDFWSDVILYVAYVDRREVGGTNPSKVATENHEAPETRDLLSVLAS